jgi:hypothetical protein
LLLILAAPFWAFIPFESDDTLVTSEHECQGPLLQDTKALYRSGWGILLSLSATPDFGSWSQEARDLLAAGLQHATTILIHAVVFLQCARALDPTTSAFHDFLAALRAVPCAQDADAPIALYDQLLHENTEFWKGSHSPPVGIDEEARELSHASVIILQVTFFWMLGLYIPVPHLPEFLLCLLTVYGKWKAGVSNPVQVPPAGSEGFVAFLMKYPDMPLLIRTALGCLAFAVPEQDASRDLDLWHFDINKAWAGRQSGGAKILPAAWRTYPNALDISTLSMVQIAHFWVRSTDVTDFSARIISGLAATQPNREALARNCMGVIVA